MAVVDSDNRWVMRRLDDRIESNKYRCDHLSIIYAREILQYSKLANKKTNTAIEYVPTDPPNTVTFDNGIPWEESIKSHLKRYIYKINTWI